MRVLIPFLSLVASFLLQVPAALADSPVLPQVDCQKDMNFDRWLTGVFKEATLLGISRNTLELARPQLTYDATILRRDGAQGVFQQSFLQFSDRMASKDRIVRGARLLKTQAALFQQIERDYGVPAPVLLAFWGLETDFGADMGKYPTLTAVTTLAYDCRRAAMFRDQLLSALQMIERGDQRPETMLGDWAGELGGLMISPSDYFHYGVDNDHDGHRDLVRSVSDTLASGANFLKNLGWQANQPWMEEVRLPAQMAWEEADLVIQHPRSYWAQQGVRAASGTLVNDEFPASLLLPMGRLGPAFLVYPNFKAYLGWNAAMVYSTTAAYLATRIAGAPAVGRGNGTVTPLSIAQVTEIQKILARLGFQVGAVDGKLGNGTRAAIKQAQLRVGLPADSYPTVELLEKLRAIR
ncbi:MAG: lytic murein transglycosylase [Bdellovibrionota bacterium]